MARTLQQFCEELLEELGEDPTAPVLFTNSGLIERWIANGVRAVSLVRPLYATTTITPQEDVLKYDAPSGMIRLDRVAWIPSTSEWNEVEIDAVYEPHTGKIHILGNFVSLPPGEVLTVEYTKYHTMPEAQVSSSIPDKYEDAVLYFALRAAYLWLARKMAANNQGVLTFTRGRYSEDGRSSIKGLVDLSDKINDQAKDILNFDEPGIEETRGVSKSHYESSPGIMNN